VFRVTENILAEGGDTRQCCDPLSALERFQQQRLQAELLSRTHPQNWTSVKLS